MAKRMAECSNAIRSRPVEAWFDLWHVHPDFKAKANRAAPLAAQATLRLLDIAEGHFASRKEPVQVFATLCEDTGNNAVYLHTSNPNGTEFPHTFAGTVWGGSLPEALSSVGVGASHEVGRVQYQGEVVYLVRARA